MPARSRKKDGAEALLRSVLVGLLSVPLNFLGGLVVGLTAPVIAVAGVLGGVYLFTKKVPFVSQVDTDDVTGERSLTLTLMEPGDAKAALEARQAELKEALVKIKGELAEITRQASEKPPSPEES